MRIQPQPLSRAVSRIFVTAGCQPDEADCVARHLVDSNLCGHDSHGVIRVSRYIEFIKAGTVRPGQCMSVVFENDTMVVIDGHMGFGQVIGEQAMGRLADKTKKSGLALATVRNCGHAGRLGAWAEQLAEHDLISLHFLNTTGRGMCAVPFGGTDRRQSLCVIAACLPVDSGEPILFDGTTSTTAEGKLFVARNQGVPVPAGQIIDKHGNPTTDPNDFYAGGAILPMGGHKGYGLNIIADILAGALSGGGCTRAGVEVLVNTVTSIAIDPAPLTDREAYFAEIKRYCDWVTGSPPREPRGEVLLPGQKEHRTRNERKRNGIPLDETTWQQLIEAAVSVGMNRQDFDELRN